jgi:outer membrane protein assembly factor BamE (lipoprotein component of BamABCDE complex)
MESGQVASAQKLVYRFCRLSGKPVFDRGERELLLLSQDFKTSGKRIASASVMMLAAGAVLSACSASSTLNPSETLTQGYVIDQDQIDLVPVGSSREQVLLALGTPSTTATFDNEVFYYISQTRVRRVAFMNPRIVDQRILAVYFGDDGRVTQIAHYGLQDGKIFDFVSRTTPTGGKDQSFIGQLLAGASSTGASAARNIFGGGGG